tara:strand:+ start:2247 stop:2420 length:174 start_codon:yes stop_codon:yes gene_type:complete
MKKILIIIILISGCSSYKEEPKNNFADIKFSDDLSIEQFRNKLNEYAENNPYPNIDN